MKKVLHMLWEDLCFLHWPLEAAQLRPLIPPGLAVDEFEGKAWLGLVPFTMSGVKPRGCPDVPGLSAFPEYNVRTYVRDGQHSGVWFFSLDAAQWLAVRLARQCFYLPYFDARFRRTWKSGICHYEVERTHAGAPPLYFKGRFGPTAEIFRSQVGSLEEWLTERYWLFSADPQGGIWKGRVHHERWPLQPAQIELDDYYVPQGLTPQGPPHSQLFVGSIRVYADLLIRAQALPG